MKKLSRKGVVFFGAALAVCAFAAPMGLAASWSVVGTTHQLFSSDLSFTIESPSVVGWSCANSEFDVDVASVTDLEITGARFLNCRGTGVSIGCTVTPTGTQFPWTVTAPATTNIQIHGINLDVTFENGPGTGCNQNGFATTLTGTLTTGAWDPSATGANRRITFAFAPGLTLHSSQLGSNPVRTTGSLRDTTGTLNLFD